MISQINFTISKESEKALFSFVGDECGCRILLTESSTGDFVFVTLYFSVSDTASAGNYTIAASYNADDIYNIEETNVDFAVMNGKMTVTE